MENNNSLQEISLAEIVQKTSIIISKNKLVYLLIFVLISVGGLGLIINKKMNPEYKAQVLLGSKALNLPILKVIVADINLQVEEAVANNKFSKNENVYSEISDLRFGNFDVSLADEKNKDLEAYKLEIVFFEPHENLNFDEISNVILEDIENKARINALIFEEKKELEKNIEVINESILKAKETEEAIRENIKNNKSVSIIGITEFYTDLNNLITKKNALEKSLAFYEDGNLVYKLTNFSFDNNSLSSVKLIAYCLFLGLFLSFAYTIGKLALA